MTVARQRNPRSAVVLLSGGLDSTVALAIYTQAISDVVAVTFDYGQVNRDKELAASRRIASHYGVEHRIIGLGSIFIPSALTGSKEQIPNTPALDGPDATFVPGRNIVLISVGVAIAQGNHSQYVVTGCNAADAAGYPDTTGDFMLGISSAAEIGYGITVVNPLLNADKRQILSMSTALQVPIDLTWSCYRNGETQCGNCGACLMNTSAAL